MSRQFTRPPGSESSDRLTVTLFLAGAFHLIVILGGTFAPPLQDPSLVPTLEVLLVNNSLPDAPANDRASYLAERTQQGGGNSPAARTRQPGAGDAPRDAPGAAAGGDEPPAVVGQAGGEGRLMTALGGPPQVIAGIAEADAVLPTLPRQALAGQPSPFAGQDDDAEIELKGRERRELLVTASTRSSVVAVVKAPKHYWTPGDIPGPACAELLAASACGAAALGRPSPPSDVRLILNWAMRVLKSPIKAARFSLDFCDVWAPDALVNAVLLIS